MEVNYQLHAPGVLPPGKEQLSRWKGNCVDPGPAKTYISLPRFDLQFLSSSQERGHRTDWASPTPRPQTILNSA
jgi:hypothetical protein